jgi:hypothetical protein
MNHVVEEAQSLREYTITSSPPRKTITAAHQERIPTYIIVNETDRVTVWSRFLSVTLIFKEYCSWR